MGLLDWFSRPNGSDRLTTEQIEQEFSSFGDGAWPHHIPLTEESLKVASKTHDIFVENYNVAIREDEDEADWRPTKSDRYWTTKKYREKARDLVKRQPNCSRAIRLYSYYIAGNGFSIGLVPVDKENATEEHKEIAKQVDRLWRELLERNHTGFSFREWVIRTYRDGEAFIRLYSKDPEWPPRIRFVDPETIADGDGNEENGVQTKPDDLSEYTRFTIRDEEAGTTSPVSADDMIFVKLDSDSTEVRGCTRLSGVIEYGPMLRGTIRNEVIHRNLQSSIVLQRKVAGGRTAALGVIDHQRTGSTDYPEHTVNRESIRPGSILTTTKGVELEFKQPSSNFSDASPLIAVLIQQIAATTGWPYEFLSSDSSQGNLASVLSQDGPTQQMVISECDFHTPYIVRLYRWFVRMAVKTKVLDIGDPKKFWEKYEVVVKFGDPVPKDRLKEAQRVGGLVLNQTFSRAQARRELGVDNARIEMELREEVDSGLYNPALGNQMGSADDKAASQQSNASDNPGGNQGGGPTPGHSDNQNAKGNQ